MLEYILNVGTQVLILFILIGVGCICGKASFITNRTARQLTDIILYIVTPCVIIDAYQLDFEQEILTNLGIVVLFTIIIFTISIAIVTAVFRGKNKSSTAVMRFGTIFSNCGFMSLPLQRALIGTEGVLYGAAFLAVFNIVMWSYGVVCMSGNTKQLSVKKLILNPGVIGVIIALTFFLTSFRLPFVLASPVEYLSMLNTPIPMIIIGYYLSKINVLRGLKDGSAWLAVTLRLVIIPLISFALLYAVGIRGAMITSFMISVSAPVAASATMFATKFNKDTNLSVRLVSLSTMLSIVTMPIMVSLSQLAPA